MHRVDAVVDGFDLVMDGFDAILHDDDRLRHVVDGFGDAINRLDHAVHRLPDLGDFPGDAVDNLLLRLCGLFATLGQSTGDELSGLLALLNRGRNTTFRRGLLCRIGNADIPHREGDEAAEHQEEADRRRVLFGMRRGKVCGGDGGRINGWCCGGCGYGVKGSRKSDGSDKGCGYVGQHGTLYPVGRCGVSSLRRGLVVADATAAGRCVQVEEFEACLLAGNTEIQPMHLTLLSCGLVLEQRVSIFD